MRLHFDFYPNPLLTTVHNYIGSLMTVRSAISLRLELILVSPDGRGASHALQLARDVIGDVLVHSVAEDSAVMLVFGQDFCSGGLGAGEG
jgi:hypothetical protein